ncbi:soluble lytic murein transglycosylase precursor [bacterium BMS3Bbin06]|nr:soluble lytic murein transglycosylase precursor [bacterium BMS3Abin08]GBE33660.1 soluble lytic murein transglycosylase precursor [bacterium BMS3Bbin06]
MGRVGLMGPIGPMEKRVLTFITAFTTVILLLAANTVHATIYKYVDRNGVIHFTDSPPAGDAKALKARDSRDDSTSGSGAVYPDYRRIAEEAARKYGVSPRLAKSVIEVESGWNPGAISRKGAMGLMQLMPETARLYGISDPFDPEENIDAGIRYLKYLIDRFGKLEFALAAYNAGPATVDRYRGIPPFRETRNYVKAIMGLYNGKEYVSMSRIYKVVLDDGTMIYTNSPVYLKDLSSF